MDLVKKIDSLIGEASWDDSWETPMKNLGKNWWSDDGVSRVVREAWAAISAVSRSRISPTITISGS